MTGQRFKLTLEYHGAGFVGWQRQQSGLSVQQVVEEAIAKFCGQEVRLHVAGRTDAGVHALGQVAHVDLPGTWPATTVMRAINFYLRPHAVAVLTAEQVPAGKDGFHARFSARRRRYLYRIANRAAPLALDRGRVWWVPRRLDRAAMAEAAHYLEGYHDFTTFRASECQADSPFRTLDSLRIESHGEEIHIHAEARSFLHHQVRNMVGSLEWVGNAKWSPAHIKQALAARDRPAGGPTAPACGLYLVAVDY